MRKFLLVAMAALFLVQLGHSSGAVMLVTDMTSVDAATAGAAADKAGVPVLVLENGMLNEDLRATIRTEAYTDIILVGGPSVIKPEVENELKANHTVIRLWGFERTGTAVAVTKYFWPEGAGCAVLVDDTKSNEADYVRERIASNLASRFNCTLVPIPQGALPADVLAMLNDLNVSKVRFVGRMANLDLREKLRNFNLSEHIGDDGQLQDSVGNIIAVGNVSLVVVATPDWRAGIGVCTNPSKNAVIVHITSTDSVQRIISFVNTHNITHVRVVGTPPLADDVARLLSEAGINVTKAVGTKPSEISRRLVNITRLEWGKIKTSEDNARIKFTLRIKASLSTQLNETIAKLDSALAELGAMENSTEVENAKTAIEAAKEKLMNVQSILLSGDLDGAKKIMFQLMFTADAKKMEMREKLKVNIDEEIKNEEHDFNSLEMQVGSQLSEVESKLMEIRGRCANTDLVDTLIEKAKSLRVEINDEKDDGNFSGAANNLVRSRELVSIARHVGDACIKHGMLPRFAEKSRDIAGLRFRKPGIIVDIDKPSQAENESGPETHEVQITRDSFSPKTLRIHKGDTVMWENVDNETHWPASAYHPTHTLYPGSDIAKCGSNEAIFDACRALAPGENFSFVFNEVGTWPYHDHRHTELQGSIAVVNP